MNGIPNQPRRESKATLQVLGSGPCKDSETYEYIYDYGAIKYKLFVGVTSVNDGHSSGTQTNGIIYSLEKHKQ